jgi:hypothetical protein
MFRIFINKELLMANITNNNFSKLDLKISKSEFWDFILSKEKDPCMVLDGSFLYDDMLISHIDLNDSRCIVDSSLYSTTDYKWSDSINNGLSLYNFGFTGIDNGMILFDKDNITPSKFCQLVTGVTIVTGETSGTTGTTYVTGTTLLPSFTIPIGDTRLVLNMVSGNTKDYIYPFSFVTDINGNHIKLEGGFYQGFFKSGDEYSVLPDQIQDEISFEFILKPDFITIPQPGTLNYKHPNNKGIFFYMGVRSENKFWYDYFKQDIYDVSKTGQTSPLDLTTGLTLHTNDGFQINYQNIYDIPTDNKYLLFNRTPSGHVVSSFNTNDDYHITGKTQENLNYYLYMNRTETGYTASNVNDLTGLTKPYTMIDDIVNNNIAFRIKDDGSIGYRMINKNCTGETGYSIDEEYSSVNVVRDSELTFINVRVIMGDYSQCGDANRTFKLWFYVNGKLVFVSKELPELILRALSDRSEKQETIPYNISFGGGSQGLSDMIGFNTGYSTQFLFPIEQNFAGSFIGTIYKFKIYYGKMDYSKIRNNFTYQYNNLFNPGYVIPTIDFWISGLTITPPESNYKRETGNVGTVINANIKLNDAYAKITGYRLYYYLDSNLGIQINGTFSITPSGGTIPEYIHNDSILAMSGLTSIKYMIEVLDTNNNNPGSEKVQVITFDNMIFYGASSSEPVSGNEIRLLRNRRFNLDTTSFTLETGAVDSIFIIAIPESRTLYSVYDQTVFMLDIKNLFNETQLQVPDAGGNLTNYNVYIMKNAIAYNKNHNFIVTLS